MKGIILTVSADVNITSIETMGFHGSLEVKKVSFDTMNCN